MLVVPASPSAAPSESARRACAPCDTATTSTDATAKEEALVHRQQLLHRRHRKPLWSPSRRRLLSMLWGTRPQWLARGPCASSAPPRKQPLPHAPRRHAAAQSPPPSATPLPCCSGQPWPAGWLWLASVASLCALGPRPHMALWTTWTPQRMAIVPRRGAGGAGGAGTVTGGRCRRLRPDCFAPPRERGSDV